ncbi:MAG: zinc-dependent peptidase [Candidatus Hydrogenedentes bacterium]|nr:zinc-dependent peptidase [Candidatus Hydrogenedentota bacterium]
MLNFFKKRKRARLRARRFPDTRWQAIAKAFPYAAALPAQDRTELQGHVNVFLDEKHFEGCGGLVLTEEMRYIIAGQACALLLHRDTDYFPSLRSVLVYPEAYEASRDNRDVDEPMLVTEEDDVLLGEAWSTGAVVLSWREIAERAEGRNLVLHEFAHLLDEETGDMNGIPFIADEALAEAWPKGMSEAYDRHVRAVERGRDTVIDPYGADAPEEFFAVCVEAFFEIPRDLQRHEPVVYSLLQRYFHQDPATTF